MLEIKKREGSKIVINKEAQAKIEAGLCGYCSKPKALWNRRKDWRCCSPECTSKFEYFLVIRSWQELRTKALYRDGLRCVKCGKQPEFKVYRRPYYLNPDIDNKYFLREEDGMFIYINDSELIGDHIIPIALGGDEWDIDNIQTLCKDCNKIKTAKDIREIAAVRKAIKNKQQTITDLIPTKVNNQIEVNA